MNYRNHLKNPSIETLESFGDSDQRKGIVAPPLEQPIPEDAERIELVPVEELTVGRSPLFDVISARQSRREYTQESLSLEEMSYLLWATQGIRRLHPERKYAFRTVPSGGVPTPVRDVPSRSPCGGRSGRSLSLQCARAQTRAPLD